jgi:putative membrane protein
MGWFKKRVRKNRLVKFDLTRPDRSAGRCGRLKGGLSLDRVGDRWPKTREPDALNAKSRKRMNQSTAVITPLTRNRTLSRVALYATGMGLYSALPVWNDRFPESDLADVHSEIHAALTLVLGWLLVFRTNTAYSRWWEARTLWGRLVNASRNLAQKVTCLVEIQADHLQRFRRPLLAFPYALRDHLRSEDSLAKVPGYETSTDTPEHIPNYLVSQLYQELRECRRQKLIDGDEMRAIDDEMSELLDICGGCERIYKTRVVTSYRIFARQCVLLYLVTLPWGISNDMGFWTIPMTMIISYFMLGLETVAEHVEEPFGRDEDDLDLDGLCQTIDRSAGEIFDRFAVVEAS